MIKKEMIKNDELIKNKHLLTLFTWENNVELLHYDIKAATKNILFTVNEISFTKIPKMSWTVGN